MSAEPPLVRAEPPFLSAEPPPMSRELALLAGVFAASGTTHLMRPSVFEPLVPPWVPGARGAVLVSGVVELVCAAGLALPRTRPAAGLLSAGLLVAVWPANLQMALDAWQGDRGTAYRLLTLARLPLQVPMIRTALRARWGPGMPGRTGSPPVGTPG